MKFFKKLFRREMKCSPKAEHGNKVQNGLS